MIAEELRVLVRAETQEAVRNLNRVEGSTNKADAGFKKIIKTLGAKAAALAAAAISIRAVNRLAQESIQLARTQIQAETRLAAAIDANANSVQGALAGYREFSSEIQSLTVVGDEAVLEMLAMAESFGLSGEEAENATQAALGLSQAFGINASTALRAYANAQQGNTEQLQRYIPAVREAANQTDAMTIINNAAAGGFEQMQAVAETSFGAMEQYSNAVGDLKEELGIAIVDAMEPFARSLTNTLSIVTSNIAQTRRYREVIEQFESGTWDGVDAADALATALAEQESAERALATAQRIRAEAQERGDPADFVERLNARVRAQLDELSVANRMVASLEREAQARAEAAAEERAGNQAEAESARQRAEAEAALREERERRAAAEAEMRAAFEANDQLYEQGLITEEQRLVAHRNARMQYINDLQAMGVALENNDNVQHIHNLNKALRVMRNETQGTKVEVEAQATAFQGLADTMEMAASAHQRAMQQMREEQRRTRLDSQKTAIEIAEEYIATANTIFTSLSGAFSSIGTMLSSYTDRHIAEMERQKEATESRYSAEIEWAEAAGATDAEIAELKRSQAEESAKAEEEIAKKQAALALRQFRMDKAMQIGQATMAGATGVVQALAMAPPNVPLSIAIGALAGTQIAAIAATQPPAFEQGGSFVTSGPQMIMVGDGQSPRERVTVEPLSGPYRGSAGGGVNVTINGVVGSREEVASWVWDAIRKGQQRGAIRA
jgi:hypothetical protein